MFKRSPLLIDPCATVESIVSIPARLSGCFGGASVNTSSSKSQQTSDPVINQQGLDMLNANGQRAIGIANQPFQPYTGSMVAPLSGNQNSAINAAPGSLNAGAANFAGASQTAGDLSGYRPPTANTSFALPGLLGPAPQTGPAATASTIDRNSIGNVSTGDLLPGIAKYQSPYENDVVQRTLNDLGLARQRQQVQDNQTATASGAFGGNRQGVADSLTNEAYLRQAGDTAAQLRQAGYESSANLAQSDASRALAAAQSNQGADMNVAGLNAGIGQFNAGAQNQNNQFNLNNILDFLKTNATNTQQTNLTNAGAANNMAQFNTNSDLAGAGVRQNAANTMLATGNAQHGTYQDYLNNLLGTGQVQQQNAQAQADAQYQEFLRQLNLPYMNQQLINQSLGLLGSTSLGQKSQGTSNSSSFGAGLSIA